MAQSQALVSDDRSPLTEEQKLIAQNLRASHKILDALSQSKEETELILDKLPELFFVIDSRGRILKANLSTSRVFGVVEEEWLSKSIDDFFTKESQKIFWSQVQETRSASSNGKHFELPITIQDETYDYHWSVNELSTLRVDGKPTYSIIGSDITEIRRLERQLSKIFSAVPLGIFILDQEGFLVGPYSSYTKHIFGSHAFREESVFDILFTKNEENLSQSQKDGIAELKLCLNEDEMWFQFAQSRFPNEIRFERDGKTIFIDIQFHAICKDGKVVNVLVVTTDVTEIVEARESQSTEQSKLHRKVAHYLAIEKTPDATVRSILDDFPGYHDKFMQGLKNSNVDDVKFALHSIKSLFRAAGISDITETIHQFEHDLGIQDKVEDLLPDIQSFLEKEWEELRGMLSLKVGSTRAVSHSSLHVRSQKEDVINLINSLELKDDQKKQILQEVQKIGFYPFKELEEFLEQYGSRTAQSLKQNVSFCFQWDSDVFDPYLLSFLKEAGMHLITNMIDHGFSNQPENGEEMIEFQTQTEGEYTKFTVTDNGCGFNYDMIYQKACEKNLTTKSRADLSEQEILSFLLAPDFSTKTKASLYSGRGVGLSTVHQLIKDYGVMVCVCLITLKELALSSKFSTIRAREVTNEQ